MRIGLTARQPLAGVIKKKREHHAPSSYVTGYELKGQPKRELQSTHSCVAVESRHEAGVVSHVPTGIKAVNASVTLVPIEAQRAMVEHIERVHAELQDKALREVEVLHDRRVSREYAWTDQEEIASHFLAYLFTDQGTLEVG